MKIATVPTFTAEISIGLQRGYTNDLFCKDELIKVLQEYQKRLIKEKEIYLSANISECEIVLSGQIEPHLKLNFINWTSLKDSIIKLSYKHGANTYEKNCQFSYALDHENHFVIESWSEPLELEKLKNENLTYKAK